MYEKDLGVKTMKLDLKSSLIARFSTTGNIDLKNSNLQIATFLDPRYKAKFLSPLDKEDIIKTMVKELLICR